MISRAALVRLAFPLAAAALLISQNRPPAEPAPSRWWRGNLHTHTLWSDGDEFPETVAQWYKSRGYHFLALSEHNTLSTESRWMPVADIHKRAGAPIFDRYLQQFGRPWVETRGDASNNSLSVRLKPYQEYSALLNEAGRFLMISSEEITGAAANNRTLHINATNLAEFIPPQPGPTVRDVLSNTLYAIEESAKRTGRDILTHVNHPNYKWGVTAEDLAAVTSERFFEIWNGVDGDDDPGDSLRPSTSTIWDIANTIRIQQRNAPPLFGLATDDSHHYQGNNPRAMPGRAWIMVNAPHLTAESIVRAIKAGNFYSSTGVTLDAITFDPRLRRYSLSIHANPGESYVTHFIGTRKNTRLNGKPRRDANGNDLESTLDYSPASIGETFAESRTLNPSFTLPNDILYVRAVITSSARTTIPTSEFAFQRAWTQPVGWTLQ